MRPHEVAPSETIATHREYYPRKDKFRHGLLAQVSPVSDESYPGSSPNSLR